MADFCLQCTEELFGDNVRNDFAGLTTEEDERQEIYAVVLCEGCGEHIQVDSKGRCISPFCKKHGERCDT